MRNFTKILRVLVVALFAVSLYSCAEDETMDELVETIEKYEIKDVSTDDNKDKTDDPTGG